MRRALRILAGLAALLALAAVGVRLLAGGPVGPLPGGWLRGELVAEPVADWSFANRFQRLEVESRARWLPFSQGSWFIAHEGRLHLLLPSLFGAGLKERLDEDARVRVRIDGRLHDLRAKRVTDESEVAALLRPALRRQFAIEVEGPLRRMAPEGSSGVELWVYRLDSP